jgi:hypothetical protein
MHILDSHTLGSEGPDLEFAALPSMIILDEGRWPEITEYRPHVFFSMPEEFIEAVCDVTNTYAFLDNYDLLQYNTPERIHGFSSQLIFMAGQVAAARIFGFDRAMHVYETSLVPEEMQNVRNLKCDMVHTLLHLSNLVNQVAEERKCLSIVGI